MNRQFSGETQLKSLKVFKIFLAIRDMDIKIIFWFCFTPVPKAVIKQTNKQNPNKPKILTNSGKNVKRKNRLPAVGGNVNWYSFCGNESGDFSHRTMAGTTLSDSTISPQWA